MNEAEKIPNPMDLTKINNQKLTNPYENLKKAYSDFTKQMNKSDFANSPRRYIIELNFIKELKNLSQSEEDKDSWIKKEEEIRQTLSKWGIEIDN